MGLKKKSKDQKQKDAGAIVQKDGKNHDKQRLITDDRFSKVHSDPRFQKVPRHKSKVAIDSRFSGVLTDKRFATSSASLDKRGKRKSGSSDKALRRYYRLEEEDGKKKEKKKQQDEEEEEEKPKPEVKGRINKEESEDSDGVSSDSESEGDADDSDNDEVDADSDASTSTMDTDEEVDVYSEDDVSAEVENVPVIEKETHRLAIVNMDWSQVKADDLFVMLSSFLPKGAQISSVSVYPSEFGLKRMEEEAVHGPAALFGGKDENDDSDSDNGDDEIDNEKLRDYERSRLRYYYAVVVCDSVATADYLYKSCDGAEFERSSNRLDMRFIPDDMEFGHPPRDQATEAPANYEGLDFQTRALQQSNVHLSWDDDEPHRVKTLKRKFNADQLADLELKEFLASDVSESEEDGEETEDMSEKKNKRIDNYRALLQSGDGSEEEEEEDERQDMEVTFNTGLEDISKKILERKDRESETVWEKYLRTKKEKKKAHKNRSKQSSDDEDDYSDREPVEGEDDFFEEDQPQVKRSRTKQKKTKDEPLETEGAASQAELELLLADDNDVEKNKKGYKIKPDKGKRKKGKNKAPAEDKPPEVDLNDPRFAAFYSNPLFAQDPTDPNWKRSASYARQVAKQKRGCDGEPPNEELSKVADHSGGVTVNKHGDNEEGRSKSDKHELSMLVKSVKMKSKQKVPVSLHSGTTDTPNEKKKKRKKDHSAERMGNA